MQNIGAASGSGPLLPLPLHLPNGTTAFVEIVNGGFSFALENRDWLVHIKSEGSKQSSSEGKREISQNVYEQLVPSLCDDTISISAATPKEPEGREGAGSALPREFNILITTLWWYFHQPHPTSQPASYLSQASEEQHLEWRVYLTGIGNPNDKKLELDLERAGLIEFDDSAAGINVNDKTPSPMYISRRAFWQTGAKVLLSSPILGIPPGFCLWRPSQPVSTGDVSHPLRPRPPEQGEVFYSRYIPSVGQYLSFRCASLSSDPVAYNGPSAGDTTLPVSSDLDLLHKWMNNPRVSNAWGEQGPIEAQKKFLEKNLSLKHSFPVIGCWDGVPFGYFEVYWVKEDSLAKAATTHSFHDYDRGFHLLVGEEQFRGYHRVKVWMSALIHYCWIADPRTESIFAEPNVNNEKVIRYFQGAGFEKADEVDFPHKRSAMMRVRRHIWHCPYL